jgi:N-sulfoglucosamine sulfohydrolase
MNSGIFQNAIICCLLAVLIAGCRPQEQRQPVIGMETPPNILWISCEDLSPRLGCYGDPVAVTPNIDRLASEGMRFTNLHATAAVCAPNRTAIITGMYQTSIGSHHMRTTHAGRTGELPTPYAAVPPHYVKAFTEYLRARGYFCTNNAKTDYQFAWPYQTPFTAWDECGSTAHYRNRADKSQPFFAVFNYTLTHESQTWQEPEYTDPAKVQVPPYYPDTEKVRRSLARLYDQVARLDSLVGKHLRELEEEGLAENTVVFFWSDHGDGLPRAKRWPYESGTRMPLIVRWPRALRPGSVSDQLLSSIDLGPTVLSLAGAPLPVHLQGKAFLGPQASEARSLVFTARDRFDESYDMVRSVRDSRYRYIRNYYPNLPYILWMPYRNNSPIMQEMYRLEAEGKLEGPPKIWFSGLRPPEELYDCRNDPHNIRNLATDPAYQGTLRVLSTALDTWRKESGDMGDISEEQMVHAWWPEGVQPQTHRPWFVPNASGNRGRELISGDSAVYDGPVTIDLYCATQGASLGIAMNDEAEPVWKIFTGPVRLGAGTHTIRAKAIRYGYLESEEVRCTITVRP